MMSRDSRSDTDDDEESSTEFKIRTESMRQKRAAKHERQYESVRWVLERKSGRPFGAQIFRKAVQIPLPYSDNIVGLIIKHNTHAVEEHWQFIQSVAIEKGYGKWDLRKFQQFDKTLVIDDDLFSERPPSVSSSPSISDRGHSSGNRDTDEIEKEYRSIWDSQACSTCHDLRPPSRFHEYNNPVKKVFSWDELSYTTKAGCKFCAVLQQGLRYFLQSEPCGSQGLQIDLFMVQHQPEIYPARPLRVILYQGCSEFSSGSGPETDVEFYVHQDAPPFAPIIGIGRNVTSDSSVEDCMVLAKGWLDDCINNHKRCPTPSYQMPTRVIRVGTEDMSPVLHVTGKERSSYAALSHCWGESRIFCTTTANIHQRREGFPMASLPKTFHDAIIIARKLGIEYLWIDSLCILQDSKEDWSREAAKMADIYSGAAVVLAADAARNSADGCFGPYEHTSDRGVHIAILCVNDEGLVCHVYARRTRVESSEPNLEHIELNDIRKHTGHLELPLTLRGWCLQERLLSPRILHYCFTELAWECWSQTECQCDPFPRPVLHCNDDMRSIQYRARLLGTQAPSYDNHHGSETQHGSTGEHWFRLVEEFTRLGLSYHSDRLEALSGLATLYQSTSDEYICGHWRSDLVRSLMWGVKTVNTDSEQAFTGASRISHSQQDYDVPSWSWAAVTGEIRYEGYRSDIYTNIIDGEDDIEILDVQYDRSNTNPYGPLKNCCITARGCMLPVCLDVDLCLLFDTNSLPGDHDLQQSPPRVGHVILDVHTGNMARHDVIIREALFCTLIQNSKTDFTPRGILLRAVEDKTLPDTFRRIGYVRPDMVGETGTSIEGMIMEIALDTAERRVFKIL